MKKLLILIFLTISIGVFAPTSYSQLLDKEYKKAVFEMDSFLELKQFLYALQLQETWDAEITPKKGSALTCVNSIGAMGYWQFMPETLRFLGYTGSFKKFRHSENLQYEYIVKLLKKNRFYLDKCIPDWQYLIGTEIHGINITFSGLLAACHFAGIGGLKKFLKTGYRATDGNAYITHYLDKFQGYKFGLTI